MNFASLGDGVRQFHQNRQNVALKTTLNTLVTELSSGEKSDFVRATGGDTTRLSFIDNRLKVLDSLSFLTRETQLTLSTMQTALTSFNTQREALAEQLIQINAESPDFQIGQACASAAAKLDSLVATLNTRLGDESLFAGAAVDQAALISDDAMLADIVAQIGGATDTATILTTVNTWFDDPAGGFATLGYTGDTGEMPERRLDAGTNVSLEARADDPGIREVLKGSIIAALSLELTGLDKTTQTDLLFEGGIMLQSAATDITEIQARIGYAESEVERFSVSQSTEVSALGIARNQMVQADPFETASELQAIQLQLETHYMMTARMSQLSLVEYLR